VRNLKLLQTSLMLSIVCARQCGASSGRHTSASSSISVFQPKFITVFILQMRQFTAERSFYHVLYLVVLYCNNDNNNNNNNNKNNIQAMIEREALSFSAAV